MPRRASFNWGQTPDTWLNNKWTHAIGPAVTAVNPGPGNGDYVIVQMSPHGNGGKVVPGSCAPTCNVTEERFMSNYYPNPSLVWSGNG